MTAVTCHCPNQDQWGHQQVLAKMIKKKIFQMILYLYEIYMNKSFTEGHSSVISPPRTAAMKHKPVGDHG